MSTSISLKRDLCFVEIIEGETDALQRQVCEAGLFGRIFELGVDLESLEINAAGCFVTLGSFDLATLKAVATSFNIALRVRRACGQISLRRERHRPLPPIPELIAAFHREAVSIVHVAASESSLCVLVDSADVHAASAIVDALRKSEVHKHAA